MFKPKKLAKFCKDCGEPIIFEIFSIEYDSETGKVTKERHVAHCWNTEYSDIDTNNHYFKSWYIRL